MENKKVNNNKPITIKELQEEAEKRVSLIKKEFEDGFNFIMNHPKSVTFFGSARFEEENIYYQQARDLSAKVVKELNYSVLSGGGPGIMEASNRGAFETGGHSLGLSIKLPYEQDSNPYMTEELNFYYFFSRKVCLSFSAEAYIFFPGGLGTLDEFFEILTLIQTGKIDKVPVILVGEKFWKPLLNFIEEILYNENKTIDKEDIDLYKLIEDFDEIIEIIKNVPIRHGIKLKN